MVPRRLWPDKLIQDNAIFVKTQLSREYLCNAVSYLIAGFD